MNISLKQYQQEAVDKLASKIESLLQQPGSKKICVFQAPTGSGKTVMTASLINTVINDSPAVDMCFLWMSIGKGDLHLQSKHSLERAFGEAPRVFLLEDEFTGGRDTIRRNEVVVANWEKLRSKDSDTGDWLNLLMKNGERLNFRDVLTRTRQERRIVLIIDESHIGATAERTTELRNEIDADVVLEMSATPRLRPRPQDIEDGTAAFVYVNSADVINEGMIKKELLINENLDQIAADDLDSQAVVLEAAYQKRIQLKQLFEDEHSDVNPLVLIQIPNAQAGDDKLHAAVEFLAAKDISEANGRLGIWLADQRTDTVDMVAAPDNAMEFLIFKQAIDTGWDCPRAHILVKFRESHSETFEIQTVGRILRMPELKHYASEDLNRGYIFTNVQSIIVAQEECNPNIIKQLKSVRIGQYNPIALQSCFRSRADYGDVTSAFGPIFASAANNYFGTSDPLSVQENIKKLGNKGFAVDSAIFRQDVILNANVAAATFDDAVPVAASESIALVAAGNDIQALFEQLIVESLGPFRGIKRSVPPVKVSVYDWFRKYLGSGTWESEIPSIQRLCVREDNKNVLKAVLMSAIEKYKTVRDEEIAKREESSEIVYPFDVPEANYFNEYADERVQCQKYVHTPCYLNINRSSPERQFERFLNDNIVKVAWWWKNGENRKDYFGVRYEFPVGSVHTFYPDYLVLLADGRLCLFEVKDMRDQDGLGPTKAKAERLQKYIGENSSKRLFGGIVIEKNNTWLINALGTYDWKKCLQNDWNDWKQLNI